MMQLTTMGRSPDPLLPERAPHARGPLTHGWTATTNAALQMKTQEMSGLVNMMSCLVYSDEPEV